MTYYYYLLQKIYQIKLNNHTANNMALNDNFNYSNTSETDASERFNIKSLC